MDMQFWLEQAEAELRRCNDGTKGLWQPFPAVLPVAAPRPRPLQQQTQRGKSELILGPVRGFLGADDVRE
jgi:hypothetical protein